MRWPIVAEPCLKTLPMSICGQVTKGLEGAAVPGDPSVLSPTVANSGAAGYSDDPGIAVWPACEQMQGDLIVLGAFLGQDASRRAMLRSPVQRGKLGIAHRSYRPSRTACEPSPPGR